jgi:hypothetical protein
MRGENLDIGYFARIIRESCLSVQDNLESDVEFLPLPRQQGSLVAHWSWPIPTEMVSSSTGGDTPQTKKERRSGITVGVYPPGPARARTEIPLKAIET